MFQLINTSLVPLTRAYASRVAAMASYDGDRHRDAPQGKARVAWLDRLLAEGKFHSPKWAFARLGGIQYRVNGGHSSFMLANTNHRFPNGMSVVLDEFTCKTQSDLADLFDQFDNRHSLRTLTDKVNAHKACDDIIRSVSATDVKNAVSGIAWYLFNVGDAAAMDEDRRIRLMHEFPEFVAWAAAFVRPRGFRRSGVVAAMFATSETNRLAATQFWQHVTEEDHADNQNPTRSLAKFLVASIGDGHNGKSKWPPRAFYVKCVHAWNAWRDGRGTDLSYYPTAPFPKVM